MAVIRLPRRIAPAALLASGFCAPCEAEAQQAASSAETRRQMIQVRFASDVLPVTEAAVPPPAVPNQGEIAWSGILAQEGVLTGDGRFIQAGAVTWDVLPMPLRWCPIDNGSHDGAIVVGKISVVQRDEAGNIMGEGTIDTAIPEGAALVAGMRTGLYGGVSVDLDDMEVQVRVPAAIAEQQPPGAADADGMVTVYEGNVAQEQLLITSCRMRAATMVPVPAFAEAHLQLAASAEPSTSTGAVHLTAAALPVPVDPPAAWFADPKFAGPTPLTFTDDGRVFGHIALYGTCHTGFAGQCVTPPKSQSNYAWFNTGALKTAEGTEVHVGRITMDTGHAGPRLTAAQTVSHYDNTGAAVADVHAGQDKHGIYVAGALRPGITPERLRALRSAPMSGDWRSQRGGNLELVGILAVNLPGFPVPRAPQALVASGAVTSLQLPIDQLGAIGQHPVAETPKVGLSLAIQAKLLERGMKAV